MQSYHKYVYLCLLIVSNMAIAGITFKKPASGNIIGSISFTLTGNIINDTCQTNVIPSSVITLPQVTTGELIANANDNGTGIGKSPNFTITLSGCPELYRSKSVKFEFTGYQLQYRAVNPYAILAYSNDIHSAHNASLEVFHAGDNNALNASNDMDSLPTHDVYAILDSIPIDSSGSGSQRYQIGYVAVPEFIKNNPIAAGPIRTTLNYTVFYP